MSHSPCNPGRRMQAGGTDFLPNVLKMASSQNEVSPQEGVETQEPEVAQTTAPSDAEACASPPAPRGVGDSQAKAYADSTYAEQRARLIYSIKAAYPIFDQCMCEAAVDMFMLYPDLAPDEILRDVPSTYFLDNIPTVTVPDQPEIQADQVEAGVPPPSSDADPEGHSGESDPPPSPSPGEQAPPAPDSPGPPGETVQS